MTAYWDVFGEIFGMPMRIGKTNSQNPADRRQLRRCSPKWVRQAGHCFPDGTDIEIKESTRGDAYNVYDKRIDRANSEISKGILNQTMTIDSGSSLSQSETHLEVFENVCAADHKLIQYIVNDRLIPKMIKHGFPLAGMTFDWDNAATYTPNSSANSNVCCCNTIRLTRSISSTSTRSRSRANARTRAVFSSRGGKDKGDSPQPPKTPKNARKEHYRLFNRAVGELYAPIFCGSQRTANRQISHSIARRSTMLLRGCTARGISPPICSPTRTHGG